MALTPAHLRCEYRTDPLGIDVPAPRLSWILEAPGRAQRQTAYQVLVAGSLDRLATDEGDLWDSGRVASAATHQVAYAGAPLASRQGCWWKVRAWDQDGAPGAYSAPAAWEMGLLAPADWRASWIGLPAPPARAPAAGDAAAPPRDEPPSPYLRTRFAVAGPVRRARIYATARGVYELHLNGRRIGDALLAPGWTDYGQRIQYQTYDVTGLLQPGANALGAVLGPGWYSGYIGYRGEHQIYGAEMQLLLQLHLDYEDGSTAVLAGDGGWRAASGAILASDLLGGETYDARREPAGWAQPDFDDHHWATVTCAPLTHPEHLVADCSDPVRITGEIAPVALTYPVPGSAVFDLGQNIAGWARLRVQGPAGTRVQLRFAEALAAGGTLYTANLRGARQTDTYILRGGGEEIFAPHFTVHGFRYVEITGYPGALEPAMLTGCVVQSDTPPAGTFSCSHALVNRLQDNIVWSQRGNFLSIPTDCPQRDERMGWLGDAQIFIRTACWNADVAAFFTKWMADVAAAQSAAGRFRMWRPGRSTWPMARRPGAMPGSSSPGRSTAAMATPASSSAITRPCSAGSTIF